MLKQLVFLAIISVACACEPDNGQDAIFRVVKKVSEGVNAKCPLEIDSLTVLDSTTASRVATLSYFATLRIDTANYDLVEFKKTMRQNALTAIRTKSEGKVLTDILTTFEYDYRDTLGHTLFKFKIEPKDYMESIDYRPVKRKAKREE